MLLRELNINYAFALYTVLVSNSFIGLANVDRVIYIASLYVPKIHS